MSQVIFGDYHPQLLTSWPKTKDLRVGARLMLVLYLLNDIL